MSEEFYQGCMAGYILASLLWCAVMVGAKTFKQTMEYLDPLAHQHTEEG